MDPNRVKYWLEKTIDEGGQGWVLTKGCEHEELYWHHEFTLRQVNPSCSLATDYFCSTFLAFLPGRVLPFDFLKILPRLVRASPLPIVVPPVVIV